MTNSALRLRSKSGVIQLAAFLIINGSAFGQWSGMNPVSTTSDVQIYCPSCTATSLPGQTRFTPTFVSQTTEYGAIMMDLTSAFPTSPRGGNYYYGIRIDTNDTANAQSAGIKVNNSGAGDSYYTAVPSSSSGMPSPSGYAFDMNFSATYFGTLPCTHQSGCENNSNGFAGQGFIGYDWTYTPPSTYTFLDGNAHNAAGIDTLPRVFEFANVSGGRHPIGRVANYGHGPALVALFAGGGSNGNELAGHLIEDVGGSYEWFAGRSAGSSATYPPYWTGANNSYQICDVFNFKCMLQIQHNGTLEAPQGLTINTLAGGGKRLVCIDNSGNLYGASGTSCP